MENNISNNTGNPFLMLFLFILSGRKFSINKIISALQDHSIRGTSLGSSSAGYTEWNSTLCLDNQTKTGIVYSSSYSDGVKFTLLDKGKEKEANKLFGKLKKLLDQSRPSGWVDVFQEFEVTGNIYFYLRDRDPNKTKEVRLKLEESFGKYSVFLWFDVYR